MKARRWWIGLGIVAVLGIAFGIVAPTVLGTPKDAAAASRYLTQPVDRGPIRRVVSASGTLNPVNLVQVGSAVSGTIRALDVDYNATVRAGQRLALIDPALLDADLEQARAQTRQAAASRDLARAKLERQRSLFEQGFVTRTEFDEARTSLATATATLEQQRAAERRAASNRAHAEIRSPVSGTVVSREVAVGQTVAASLQTPVLFRIAQDLRDMQIEVNVSEADVGALQEGQRVAFTVDAAPERTYEGTLAQIRNNYTLQQNVVTYTAVVRTRNDDLSLRPGMTAYVSVTVAERSDALRVPNAALRYAPAGTPPAEAGRKRSVWKLGPDGRPLRVEPALGIADSRFTEATDAAIAPGDALIVGEAPDGDGFPAPRIF